MQYRIVSDKFLGYEVQYKYSWWPFWFQADKAAYIMGRAESGVNPTLKLAEEFAAAHKNLRDKSNTKFKRKVIKELDL